MNMMFFYPIAVFIAGAMTAFQPLINTRLSQNLDSPIWASFISFVVGTILLLIVGLMMNGGKFMTLEIEGLKWWMFIGGALGAVFVTLAIYAVPHMGVATMIAILIAGQLIFSAILSHYGVLADIPRPMTIMKFSGLVLLGIGALMTLKG